MNVNKYALDFYKTASNISQDTMNSSRIMQKVFGADVNSERSYLDKDSQEYKNKSEIEMALSDKNQIISELRQELVLKRIRITKQEQRIAETTKDLENGMSFLPLNNIEKLQSNSIQQTMQETINDLKKLNEETTDMYQTKLYNKENEIETMKKDIESQK
jgi:hypothetical protein